MSARTLLKHVSWFVGAWAIAALLMVGCHCSLHGPNFAGPYPVYAGTAPPEAHVETPGPQGAPDQVWAAGHWHWSEIDAVWQWRDGKWLSVPTDGAVLVAATYEQRGDIWVYTAPYWRGPNEPDPPKSYPQTIKSASDDHALVEPGTAEENEPAGKGAVASAGEDGDLPGGATVEDDPAAEQESKDKVGESETAGNNE